MYTLIAYRPNQTDYCRGCHMGSSDSDFSIEYFEATREGMANMLDLIKDFHKADFDVRSNREYANYELTILCNGVELTEYDPQDASILEKINSLKASNERIWLQEEKEVAKLKEEKRREQSRLEDIRQLEAIQKRLAGK